MNLHLEFTKTSLHLLVSEKVGLLLNVRNLHGNYAGGLSSTPVFLSVYQQVLHSPVWFC